MNEHLKPTQHTKAPEPSPADTTKNVFAAPTDMLSTKTADAIVDIARHANNLFRLYAERLQSDDGYQEIDPKTVVATFQEFVQSTKVDPAAVVQQQFELWSDLTLLCQRTATRI